MFRHDDFLSWLAVDAACAKSSTLVYRHERREQARVAYPTTKTRLRVKRGGRARTIPATLLRSHATSCHRTEASLIPGCIRVKLQQYVACCNGVKPKEDRAVDHNSILVYLPL